MRTFCHLTITLVLSFAVVLAAMTPAAGHTGFESSDPPDGATVAEPVHEIRLTFTGEARPAGDGFRILDPSGEVRAPNSATTVDNATWILGFDPPLTGGVVGVRWSVKAPDAHPIDGGFSFTVDVVPEAELGSGDARSTSGAPATTVPLRASGEASPEASNIEDFLAAETDTAAAKRVGAAARVMTLVGTLAGVGALIFASVVLRGDDRDIRYVLFWVRRAGVLAVVGSTIELIAQITVEGGGDWAALGSLSGVGAVVVSSFGVAVALRIVGGVVMATGARLDIGQASEAADPVVAIKSLVGVGAGPRAASSRPHGSVGGPGVHLRTGEPFVHQGDHAWQPTVGSAGAGLGAALLVTAHLFDGHTVSAGSRILTAIAAAAHVFGGAVWAGGLFMLGAILWRRHRHGRELRALQLALRFSVVATLALAVVGIAGLALSVAVLDEPAELWTTEWGRTLVLKTLFVGVAASAGAFNHTVVIPQLVHKPDDPEMARRFRSVVTFEAVALVAVVLATAALMGAAS